MSRIKIALPAHFTFSVLIPVRITDLNHGGHVGNDTILSLIHEARVQFLVHHGYTELEVDGVGLIMIDAGIEYKSELFHGDVIKAWVCAQNFNRIGFDVYYKLEKEKNGQLVAVAKTGMVGYNYKAKKMVGLPPEVSKRLSD